MEDKKEKFSFWIGFWTFFIGCVLGFIIETVFYIIKYGYFVNKQGLLYGPFKPIYGIGALLITGIYFLIKKKTPFNIFIIGVLSGTIFEYLASLFIEIVFKSYIWDYSSFPLNLNGRIYLPYCFIWGVIALVWIKCLFPLIIKALNKLQKYKLYNIISWILLVFMIINISLTTIVLVRVGDKKHNNALYRLIDKHYSRDKIKKIFPKLRPLK